MRAFFAEGVERMHIPWAVEGLPMLLHLSLFLFFGGLAIFLFNVDREVFSYVICWIGLFSLVYGLITLLPIFRHNSPYHSPLSTPIGFLYAHIHHFIFKILASITSGDFWSYRAWERCEDLKGRYQGWVLGGLEKAAEETASKRSSEIDVQILDWTISVLGDDDSLKNFFEAIPGFFNSKLVDHQRRFPVKLGEKFRDVLGGFLVRTWSSNSVDDSEKARRLDISLNVTDRIRAVTNPFILEDVFLRIWNEVPLTVDIGRTLSRWFTNRDQDIPKVVHLMAARIFLNVREKNDSWVTLAARVFGLPDSDLALRGDNLSLAVLIHISRQYLRSDYFNWRVWGPLSKPDIRNTLPRLQHDFCTLWNEIVQKARYRGSYSRPFHILKGIRHLYIALHQGTDAALTAFSASTDSLDSILWQPSLYPSCSIPCHRPHISLPLPTQPDDSSDVSYHPPTDGGNTASRQAEQAGNVIEPLSSSNPTITSEIGAAPHGPEMTPSTNPVHSSSPPTGTSLTVVVAAAPQDISSIVTLSNPLEGNEQQGSDIVARSTEPGTSQILSTISTNTAPTLAPIPKYPQNTLSESYDAGIASNSSHIAPSIPTPRPTGNTTPPCPRPRGLVNSGNTCFANAVLQLLVNSPPFRNPFRELGDLKVKRGAGVPETGPGSTPLVDATVKFFKEFLVEEESPSMQRRSQPAAGGISRADGEKKGDNVVDSFEPTYMYDAMKKKRQLKPLFVRSCAHVMAPCY